MPDNSDGVILIPPGTPLEDVLEQAAKIHVKRQCGACDVCCVWTGIETPAEGDKPGLHTYPGESCKFLAKTRLDSRRCSIYNHRPTVCAKFYCNWLAGWFSDNLRPDKCGVMVTLYGNKDGGKGASSVAEINATVTVVDTRRSGDMQTGPLAEIINELLCRGVGEINVINHKSTTTIHFHHGYVYAGQLLKPNSPEELNFVCDSTPIAEYQTLTPEEYDELCKSTSTDKNAK